MSWQSQLSWQLAQQRAKILQTIRQFFLARNIVEVETPLLSQGTITDVYLDAFECRYSFLDSNESQNYYLQTSPEYAMKRLLASGYQSIYQICKSFRHEEHGQHHNPEFTMLEWYRLGFDQHQLIEEVGELLQAALNISSWQKLSYQQAFIKYIGIDPLDCSCMELKTLLTEHDKLSDWLADSNDIDTLLQFIFSELVEPNIGLKDPCFIYNFPASQASLAKINKSDNRVAERFECYYLGLELVNGFNELTDATEQEKRFHRDNKKRKLQGLKEKPIDKHFIAALCHGLPECSGVALGIDRLIMLALNKVSIKDVLSFPIERA